jgi:hypothetical protein
MNDPHVTALHYSVIHGDWVDYTQAKPFDHDEPGFHVHVENLHVRFDMKDHYATQDAARAAVEPFIRSWELSQALENRPGAFELRFDSSNIVDRNPPAGAVIHVQTGDYLMVGFAAALKLSKSAYPPPPTSGTLAVDDVVDAMLGRYRRFVEDRTILGDAGNFCLTMVEKAAGGKPNARTKAANQFGIDKPVLDMIALLCAIKGGIDARKANGVQQEFSSVEKEWLVAAIKAVIRRAAQVAADPSQAARPITMADLPKL